MLFRRGRLSVGGKQRPEVSCSVQMGCFVLANGLAPPIQPREKYNLPSDVIHAL